MSTSSLQSHSAGMKRAIERASSAPAGLDDHTWLTVERRRAFGVDLLVRANSRRRVDDILLALPPGEDGISVDLPHCTYSIQWGVEGDSHGLHLNGMEIFRSHDSDVLLTVLRADAMRAVAAHGHAFTFLHAGAVKFEGKLIVIPGISGAGKTTLVRSLIGRGAEYYSDEYAVLDEQGRCHPYPCPLSIKDGATGVERRVTPGSIGATIGNKPAYLDLVAFSAYAAHAMLCIEKIDRGLAVLNMLQHMPSVGEHPRRTLATAALAVRNARCLQLRHADSDAAATELIRYVGGAN